MGGMLGPVFPIHADLLPDAGSYCATLAVTQNWDFAGPGFPVVARPDAALRNGTLTFVRSRGRTYGITCQHVVDHYRSVLAATGEPGSHSMRTMLNGFYIVQGRFTQPSAQVGQSPPDIAIRELHPGLVERLGKKSLDIDSMLEPPETIRHAYAVGFPETLKYNKPDGPGGYRVSLPQVEVLAELERRPDRRFTMFSELDKPPEPVDYSGMSGGHLLEH